jgi:hypothetical protein
MDEKPQTHWNQFVERPPIRPVSIIFQATAKQETCVEQWVLNLQQEQMSAGTGIGAAWQRQQMVSAGFGVPTSASVKAIVNDTSPYAIRMQNTEALVNMMQSVQGVMEDSSNRNVDKQDDGFIRKWK